MRLSLGIAVSAAACLGVLAAPVAASAATQSRSAVAVSDLHSHTVQLAAGTSNGTTVTFAVTSGALTITAPAAANLGSGAPGSTISDSLGQVTVNDNRAALTASWVVTASSTAFHTGTGTGAETIPAGDATYDPGVVTTTGTITVNDSNITLSGSPQAVVSGSSGVGNNSAAWTPTIAIAVPPSAVTGTYTGTITHSIS
jgi:hypothetical protein